MSQKPATATRRVMPLVSQWPIVGAGTLLLAGGGLWLWQNGGDWKFGALFLIGAILGMALYHATFGFTLAYRNAFLRREMSGVRAQILMVALAILLFAPTMAGGVSATGPQVIGGLAPVGWEVLVGSFIFGIGMQLGGGCGSGTLFTVGGGSARMVATLLFFCIGAFLATLAWEWEPWVWLRSDRRTIALGREFGWTAAMLGQLALLGAIWLLASRWARDCRQLPLWSGNLGWRRLLAGPWPLLFSAVLLALGNWLILEISGHAWSIVWGFTLWSAEIAQILGWEPQSSPFWAARVGFLERGVLVDDTSITNIGIILGAFIAAGLGGRFDPDWRVPLRPLLAAVIGGLLMGIGARMAYGCNIGAFFSGVASSSLHGWVWILGALAGNWLGVQLRPSFRLPQ